LQVIIKVVKNTHLFREDMKLLIRTIKDELPFYKKVSSNSIEYINKDDNKAALKYAHTITLFQTGFDVSNHKLSKAAMKELESLIEGVYFKYRLFGYLSKSIPNLKMNVPLNEAFIQE
jgi:hypothetical protein